VLDLLLDPFAPLGLVDEPEEVPAPAPLASVTTCHTPPKLLMPSPCASPAFVLPEKR
jgi:hypothetical protein